MTNFTRFAVPFLLAYFKNFYTWWSEASNKKQTFMLPLLNLYPQFGRFHGLMYISCNIFECWMLFKIFFRSSKFDFGIVEKPNQSP